MDKREGWWGLHPMVNVLAAYRDACEEGRPTDRLIWEGVAEHLQKCSICDDFVLRKLISTAKTCGFDDNSNLGNVVGLVLHNENDLAVKEYPEVVAHLLGCLVCLEEYVESFITLKEER